MDLKELGLGPEELSSLKSGSKKAEIDKLIGVLVQNHVALVSTPQGHIWDEKSKTELAMLSPHQRDRYEGFRKEPPPWTPDPQMEKEIRKLERSFAAAGGTLLVGTDANDFGIVPGYAAHRALAELVAAGFEPLEIIRRATIEAAEFLGASDEVGSIEVGKRADLLVVRGAPDLTFGDIENVEYVFKDGRAFDPEKLREAAKGQVGLH